MSFAPNPYYEAVYEACAKLVGQFGIVAVSNEWAPNTDIPAVCREFPKELALLDRLYGQRQLP